MGGEGGRGWRGARGGEAGEAGEGGARWHTRSPLTSYDSFIHTLLLYSARKRYERNERLSPKNCALI